MSESQREAKDGLNFLCIGLKLNKTFKLMNRKRAK